MRAKQGKRLSSHVRDMDTLPIWKNNKAKASLNIKQREIKLKTDCQTLKYINQKLFSVFALKFSVSVIPALLKGQQDLYVFKTLPWLDRAEPHRVSKRHNDIPNHPADATDLPNRSNKNMSPLGVYFWILLNLQVCLKQPQLLSCAVFSKDTASITVIL